MLHGLVSYAFMLPVSAAVATACQLSGIGGAALFSPIFLLIFPLLGKGFPLNSAAHSIASALLTEVFGFASGLLGYSVRGLVCWPIVRQLIVVSIPTALLGALTAHRVASYPTLLSTCYAILMLALSATLMHSPQRASDAKGGELEPLSADVDEARDGALQAAMRSEPSEPPADELRDVHGLDRPPRSRRRTREQMGIGGSGDVELVAGAPRAAQRSHTEPCDARHHVDTTGRIHRFRQPARLAPSSLGAVVAGSLLTGLLGVGIGEVVLPELVRVRRMPLPLAAGTSVACVVLTAATAAIVQLGALVASADGEFLQAVPWPLVCWTIPGVVIGGQLAPFIAGRGLIADATIERFAALLFAVVGLAFAAKAFTSGPTPLSAGEALLVLAASLLLVGAVVVRPM